MDTLTNKDLINEMGSTKDNDIEDVKIKKISKKDYLQKIYPDKSFLNNNKIYPRKEDNNISNEFFSEFDPNFDEKINIIDNSINLALINLNMTMNEYSLLDIESLKSMKKIDSNSLETFAINILIYYKTQNKIKYAKNIYNF